MKWKETSLAILRIVIALIFIYHGLPKLLNAAGPMGFFGSLGLPGFLAPVVGVIEVVGGLMLLLGLYSKWPAYALTVVILGALVLVQIPGVAGSTAGFWGMFGASFERDLLILVSLLVLIFNGRGAWTLKDE